MKNRDFLFLYDAALCNPNGDPDNENRPRMDAETRTNIVSDVRVKRYVRDYWKSQDRKIFVDMVGDSKVSMDTRTSLIVKELLADKSRIETLLTSFPAAREPYKKLIAVLPEVSDQQLYLMNDSKAPKVDKKKAPSSKEQQTLNAAILTGVIEKEYIDIRAFGSAFAVGGFNRAITGPIQLAWGYSLNETFLMDTQTITSIMNDGNSTFGKDHRIKYSLLAFIGTVNSAAAKYTGLSETDVTNFQSTLWDSIAALPTRSKINQYPKFHLEVIYADGKPNGAMGDMRQLIGCSPKAGKTAVQVTSLQDLELDFSRLASALDAAKQKGIVAEYKVRTSFDFPTLPKSMQS